MTNGDRRTPPAVPRKPGTRAAPPTRQYEQPPPPPPRRNQSESSAASLSSPSQPLGSLIRSALMTPASPQRPAPAPIQRQRSESSMVPTDPPPPPPRLLVHQAPTNELALQDLQHHQRSRSDSLATGRPPRALSPRPNAHPALTTPARPPLPPRRPQSASESDSSYQGYSPDRETTSPGTTPASSVRSRQPSPDSRSSFDSGRPPSRLPSLFPGRTRDRSDGELCKHCVGNFDFEQFASGRMSGLHGVPRSLMGPTTTSLLSLFDIIKSSGQDGHGCPFCNLLLDAMALPEHDPFQHPAIQGPIPDEFRNTTFESWVTGLRGQSWLDRRMNNSHPFGKSRNKIQIELDADKPDGIKERRRSDLEAQDQAALATSAAGAGAGITAASQSRSEAQTAVSAMGGVGGIVNSGRLILLSEKLPVAVRVKMHNITDAGKQGLLNISVHGYGCGVQASLSTLCSFSLRVASNYQRDGLGLCYGRIMGDHVRIEEDCRLWLHSCCQHHGEQCDKPDWFKRLPPPGGEHFRLIEIDDRWDDVFRIVEVGVTMRDAPKYAALSYVWGDAGRNALNLRKSNVAELSQRIPPRRLARTVGDAIKVTRRLGLRYIWVDSLCIIQKDPRQTDRSADELEARQSQLDQMGSIFGHAEIVIVAAGGEDANGGLAGISQPRAPVQVAREVMPDVNVLLAAQYDTTYGTWDTRAWTLQERLMSRRMLVFGKQYASYHCRHSVLREDMPAAHAGNGPPAMPHLSILEDRPERRAKKSGDGYVLLRSPYFDEYSKILEQYTWRKMTETTDAISAMRGLLDVLEDMKRLDGQPRNRRPTLHGLPEEFLDLALLWQPPAVLGTSLMRRQAGEAEDLSFPSWSWAGWKVRPRGQRERGSGNEVVAWRERTGIRFEEPFHVSGYDNMSLRKFIATGGEAEERVRSLVMWYKVVEGNLVPVNNSGLGVVCGVDAATWFFRDPLRLLNSGSPQRSSLLPIVPPGTHLDEQHLVGETQVRAFKLRQDGEKHRPRSELLWTHGADGTAVVAKELDVVEAEILDRDGEAVGHVIPTDQNLDISATKDYHFILLSVSQYWGNEKRIDVQGYSLYNVMMVELDGAKKGFAGFATRVGLGKISKAAWKAECVPNVRKAEHVPNVCVILE